MATKKSIDEWVKEQRGKAASGQIWERLGWTEEEYARYVETGFPPQGKEPPKPQDVL